MRTYQYVCEYMKDNFENIVLILSCIMLQDLSMVGRKVVGF
jgi:hypothetical protein